MACLKGLRSRRAPYLPAPVIWFATELGMLVESPARLRVAL